MFCIFTVIFYIMYKYSSLGTVNPMFWRYIEDLYDKHISCLALFFETKNQIIKHKKIHMKPRSEVLGMTGSQVM